MQTKMSNKLGLLLLATMVTLGQAKLLTFDNRMGETVWVGSQGNSGKPHINGGGWEMRPHTQMPVIVDDNWSGRFWGRTKCNGTGPCQTGDCEGIKCEGRGPSPPATLAEFTFNGWQGLDYYDISLVDGFNINLSIEPTNPVQDGYRCVHALCHADINTRCPNELRKNEDGRTVGCKSACDAFNQGRR